MNEPQFYIMNMKIQNLDFSLVEFYLSPNRSRY